MRKISNFQTASTFTSKVVMEAVYSTAKVKQTSYTFTAGYEYIGGNLIKGLSRPPKMRILGIFTPLLGTGLPNSTNDTYVIFQNYDYNLGRFRGPYCGASTKNNITQNQPLDFYVSTIDNFGKNYGDLYSGINGGVSGNFTPPAISYTAAANIKPGNKGGFIVNVNAGHSTGVLKLQGGGIINFHGFLTVSGYTGTWGLYSISNNGTLKTFDARPTDATFRSGTYPYVTPLSGKYTNEWRIMPLCDQSVTKLNYFPLTNSGSGFGGGIRYSESANPIVLGYNNMIPADIYMSGEASSSDFNFFSLVNTPQYSDEQGITRAPSGYYATANYYAYYDANTSNFSGVTAMSGGGGGGTTYTKFQLFGPFPDPEMACAEAGRAEFYTAYCDISSSGQPVTGQTLYGDDAGAAAATYIPSDMWYKVFDEGFTSLGYSITVDVNAGIGADIRCR